MPIDGIDTGFALPLEPGYVKQTGRTGFAAQAEKVEKDEKAALAEKNILQKLAEKHPEAKFTQGTGFATSHTAQLSQMGMANIMIEPRMLDRMVMQPNTATKYMNEVDRLLSSFDRLWEEASEGEHELIAWGSFLNNAGIFSTWGITDPFFDTAPLFEIFDEALMQEEVRFAMKETSALLEEEMDLLKSEQSLEEAEAAFEKQHQVNPHIQSKPATPASPGQIKDAYSVGIEKEEKHQLDIMD